MKKEMDLLIAQAGDLEQRAMVASLYPANELIVIAQMIADLAQEVMAQGIALRGHYHSPGKE